MSFAGDTKAEICRLKIERCCCAIAESCGVLMYGNMFSPERIKISTANDTFSARLPKLFKKAFNIEFDIQPGTGKEGRRSFIIQDPEKISMICNTFGTDMRSNFALHVNFALLEEECCKTAFIRGAFLSGGSVTDPEKGYHLELSTNHMSVARETCSIMHELGFHPGESSRTGNTLLYFKQSDIIADFLTAIGAPVTAMNVLTAKVDKEMRNKVTRQINCDSANVDKTISAAQEQIDAIRRFSAKYGIDAFPEALKEAALLRITNPESSLADLARLSIPSVSKSCLSYRLKKIVAMAPEEEEK
ncbi:MAG: DNA-binding protein WhiA [Eubacteriales bacterium]|nr:DNA-binding protein WhiA [Eubacteriales bacterium]